VNEAGDCDVFVIAEAGVNHNGSLALALELVDAAAEAGADAVKFQTFDADALVSRDAPKAEYQRRAGDAVETQWEMLRRLELTRGAHAALHQRCAALGIEFMSTPFDLGSLDFLVRECNLRRIKLGSGEVTNAPLLFAAGRSGRPVILSTGMSTLAEVEDAVAVLAAGAFAPTEPQSLAECCRLLDAAALRALRGRVTLLHCTTDYPAAAESLNLRAISTLAAQFGLDVGLSDHSLGRDVAVAAVALGARVIEKHFTLDRTMEGPDHAASLEPAEFADLVRAVRTVGASLGDGVKRPAPAEVKNTAVARRSLVAARPIAAGEPLGPANLLAKRPGTGLSPMLYFDLCGTPAARSFAVDEAIER